MHTYARDLLTYFLFPRMIKNHFSFLFPVHYWRKQTYVSLFPYFLNARLDEGKNINNLIYCIRLWYSIQGSRVDIVYISIYAFELHVYKF